VRVFVCEFAEAHHNTFSTIYTLAQTAWKNSWAIVTSEVYRHINIPVRGIVFGLDKTAYKGKAIGEKVKVMFADMRDSLAIYRMIVSAIKPKKDDLFIFTTFEPWLSRHYGALISLYRYLHKVGATVIVGIHNSFWFYYPENVSDEERRLVENHIKGWKKHVLLRYYLTKKLVSPQMIDGVLTLGPIKIPNNIPWIRLLDRIYEPNNLPKYDTFTISIPGAVDTGRRDYQTVAKAVSRLSFPVRVVLLGKLYDRNVLSYDWGKADIVYYEDFVPEDVYVETLKKSHVVVAPVRDPYYGLFSVTGAVGDGVMAGIPVLAPEFYRDTVAIPYSDSKHLSLMLKEKQFGAPVDYEQFSQENMAEELKRFAEGLI